MTEVTPALATGGNDAIGHAIARPRVRAAIDERAWAGMWACSALALLATASALHPASEGVGTHRQLGLPGCVWLATFDAPCPTCGMTTAFSHAAHASYGASFVAQPFGAVLAISAAATFWIALHTAITGSRALSMTFRIVGAKAIWLGIGGLLAAWVYKLVEHAA